jgi:predicted dehydrogenase
MRALIVGAGSIGRRHAENLRRLGVSNIAFADPKRENREFVDENIWCEVFTGIQEGLSWRPDVALICTPNHLHLDHAIAAVEADCHLFIEKPLLHRPDSRLYTLKEEILQRDVISMVGCNMRFHPGPKKVRELLDQECIGNIYFAQIHTGSYLPEWRPDQDYRESYSANSDMGGGCILDCVHEIDLARWYLGDIKSVFCLAQHQSSLEIDVEDVAALICNHNNGCISEIHLDYVQRTYERGCKIVGEKGSIFGDYTKEVRWYDAEQGKWTRFLQPQNWNVNQIYVDEMKHFLQCVDDHKKTIQSVEDAAEIMKTVFAAKKSVRSKKMEGVTG